MKQLHSAEDGMQSTL